MIASPLQMVPPPAEAAGPAPEPHGIGWAIDQVEAGRRVRRRSLPGVVWFVDSHGLLVEAIKDTRLHHPVEANGFELRAKDWELAE